MRKLKKILAFILILPFVFLIGCGKGNDDDSQNNNNKPSITDPENPGENDKPPITPEEPTEYFYKIEVDYKLPEAYAKLLPTISEKLKVGEDFVLPEISDEKLDDYFEGYYVNVDDTEQKLTEKYTGTANENVKIYAKWTAGFDDYLTNDYYTNGLSFQEVDDTISVSGYTGDASLVVIPKRYNEKDVTIFASNCLLDNQVIKEIILPTNIFRAEENSFTGSTLETIDFETFDYIGNGAFSGTKITDFTPASRLTYLGVGAFQGCGNLESVDLSKLSNEVDSLKAQLFKDCTSLSSITFSNSPTIISIEQQAFSGCTSLETLEFSRLTGLENIGDSAFELSGIIAARIPSTINYMGINVFDQSNLSEITLTKLFQDNFLSYNFTTYFGNLNNLTTITLEGSEITEIPDNYFEDLTTLETFNMNDEITSLGSDVFNGCTNLLNIKFSNGLTSDTFDVSAFDGTKWMTESTTPLLLENESVLCFVPLSFESIDLNDYENVSVIGKNAFLNNTTIKNVVISAKITKISRSAFENCKNLISVTFSDNSENLLNLIESRAFRGCTSLEQINLENCGHLVTISNLAFMNCTNLLSLTLPESLQTISAGAFAYMKCIIDVKVGNQNFETVENVLYKKTEGVITDLIYYPSSLDNEVFMIPNTVTKIGSYAFCNCTNLKYLYIESTITFENMATNGCRFSVLSETSELTNFRGAIYLLEESKYTASIEEGNLNCSITNHDGLTSEKYFIKFTGEDDLEHVFVITISLTTYEVLNYEDITEILNSING